MASFSKELTLERLKEFLSFQSVSTDPKYRRELDKTARWLEIYLASLGFRAETIPAKTAPLVYAETKFDKNLPTLLIYSHYDVQPADPLNEWASPPFEPTVRGGNLIARGASDSKGQLFAYIAGIAKALKEKGKLPINVKFIIEGDEEGDGVALVAFLKKNSKKLAADWVIAAAGWMLGENKPAICYGARGLAPFEIEVRTGETNLHSGTYGGNKMNAAVVLSKILASCEHPLASIEQAVSRNSFDAHSFDAGYVGSGFQFIIPAVARAKGSFRVAPDQNPDDVIRVFRKRVNRLLSRGIAVEINTLPVSQPVLLDRASSIAKAAKQVLKKTFSAKKVGWYVDGGAVPALSDLQKISKNIIMVGFGQMDDNLHAPNEKLSLKNFWRGVDFAGALVDELASGKINK
ncbi:MAG: M20/M25/M40 family metallo-hydrolase [bacterium]|nr:M20/M25/M40 family metallo-hydrolase [bacterium]